MLPHRKSGVVKQETTPQKSRSDISVDTAPASCAICQQSHGPFPEVLPWKDSVAPPAICIACVKESMTAMHIGGHTANDSLTTDFLAAAQRQALTYLPCLACHRPLPASGFPDGRIVESCQHEPEVCLDCIEMAIIESLDNNLPHSISCPQCGSAMSADDIWRFSGVGTFERYEKMIQDAKEQECATCVETLCGSRFPETRITDSCEHEPNTCLDCIGRHIEVQLETRMWNQLSCPECPALFRYAEVKKYASQATFQRYDSLAARNGISSDPNFRWCTASGCTSGQVHSEGGDSPLMICISCRSLSCFIHQIPWHEGMTCSEYDEPVAAPGAAKHPNAAGRRRSASSVAQVGGRNRQISHGGVKDRQAYQGKRDRKTATRPSKDQGEAGRRPFWQIKQENRRRGDAERRENKRLAPEAHPQRSRRECERPPQTDTDERQGEAREAQQRRARRQKEESASTNLLETKTKACPGDCGWRIEKKDGCDHMTCHSFADFKVLHRLPMSLSVLLAMSRGLEYIASQYVHILHGGDYAAGCRKMDMTLYGMLETSIAQPTGE